MIDSQPHLIAEFDERGGWHGVGIRSCAHWLAWQCGLGPGAAGLALHPAKAHRMLYESTALTMLEKDRGVLAVDRKKRRATRAPRRALLRRDHGCVHPACPENRIEGLHAHHLRHWLYGRRTDLANATHR